MKDVNNELVAEVLDEMGLDPRYDDEWGTVFVQYKMLRLCIIASEYLKGYIHISLPNIYSIDDGTSRLCAYYVSNKLTRNFRNVKVCFDEIEESLEITSECFVNSKSSLKFSLQQCLELVVAAYYAVHREMNDYLSQAKARIG